MHWLVHLLIVRVIVVRILSNAWREHGHRGRSGPCLFRVRIGENCSDRLDGHALVACWTFGNRR